jgi:hypothetical protein
MQRSSRLPSTHRDPKNYDSDSSSVEDTQCLPSHRNHPMNMNYRFNSSDSRSSSSLIEEDNNKRKKLSTFASSSSHFKNHDSELRFKFAGRQQRNNFQPKYGSCVDGEMSSDSSMENLGQAIDKLEPPKRQTRCS